MARTVGNFNFPLNFEGLLKGPIDAKQLVGTKADLTGTTTWNQSGQVWLYDGAIVAVGSDPNPANNGIYFLSASTNYTNINSWVKAGTGEGGGTITGGTNGLSQSGANITLGGNLTGGTTIIDGLGVANLTLDNINNFQITPSGGSSITFGIDEVGLLYTFTGGTISYDDNGGLKYGGDYSLNPNFGDRSLIDKGYADAIVSGLKPKQAVVLATTIADGNIDLTGGTFGGIIDGIGVNNGWRVLIKNQTSGATNGVYVYSASTSGFTRALDFDGTPSGEVVSGVYMWVLTGNTNGNTAWVLATNDPITIDVTPLNFVLFNHVGDVIAGVGIDIIMSGGTHVINVDGANLVGNSLLWTGDTFNVDINSGTLQTALNSKLNVSVFTGYTATTKSVISKALTGATNGLYTSGRNVGLGGVLSQQTIVSGASYNLCFGDVGSALNLFAVNSTNINFQSGCYLVNDSSSRGFKYGGDYGTNYTCLSIPHVGWVTGLTACANAIAPVAITGASEGINKYDCHNVCLGGTMVNGTTIFMCNTALYRTEGCSGAGSLLNLGNPNVSPQYVYAGLQYRVSATCSSGILFNNDGTARISSISGSTARVVCLDYSKALEYENDYSGSYTPRSLVDCEYVNLLVSGSTGALSGANGLSRNGDNIVLGGDLTGNTIINLCDNSLKLRSDITNSYGLVDFSLNSVYANSKLGICSRDAGGAQWGLSGNSTSISTYHCQNSSNGSSIAINNTGLTLTNKCSSALKTVNLTCNAMVYGACYHSDYTLRTLVDKEYVDKELSGTSNVINVCIIGTTYYTQRYDDLIGVSGISSNQIYLYPTPVLGQRVSVVDICGNALADPITINGQGKNINDGACSTINTDYGSVTFVYNGFFWSAIAFVN